MNIQSAQKATGLTARQIREYEKIGLLPPIARTASDYRQYSEQNIARLKFIQRARAVDFSINEIKALLALQDNPNRNNKEVKDLTTQHIAEISQKIEQMRAMKETLERWRDSCSGDGSAHCSILDSLRQ